MESTTTETPQASENSHPIPYWHTILMLLVLVVLSLLNLKSGHTPHSSYSRVRLYLATIVYEWLMVLYVWWGLRRAGGSLRELIGGRWQSVEDFLFDIAIALGGWFCAALVMAAVAAGLGMSQTGNLEDMRKQLNFLVPQNHWEVGLWVGLSATAGFCEEVLFRGYLQKQCKRLLGNQWVALVVVSVLFGLGHGYEGPQRMVLVALLGMAFGVMSLARKSLRPAMMAHTFQDTLSGLVLYAMR